MTGSLFERVGGAAAVDAAVDLFYRRVLADPKINSFFDDVDMDEQRGKQKSFLTLVFGGPNTYSGTDLRTAHASLVGRGLDGSHFDAVAGHLQATLNELGLAADVVREIMATVAGTRHDVLNT